MKKLFFALLPALVLSCSGNYTISGTTPEGVDTITLRITDTAEVFNESRGVVAGETFSFSGKLDNMSTATIFMKNGEEVVSHVRFVMSNENITILSDTTARGGLSADGNLSGKRLDEIKEKIYASESEDVVFILLDSLLSVNPADEAVPYLVNSMKYYLTIQQYDSILAKIAPSLNDSKYLANVAETFECIRKTDVGQPFSDFTCPTADGQPLQLSSIAGKGTWLLVDFWASWCGPCRGENPNVVAAYRKYHDKGFDILGVSLDKDAEKWAEAIQKDSLTWTHVSDLKMWDSPSRNIYGVMAIPSNVLIAPDGIIAARNLRGEQLEEFLSEKLD